MRTFEFIVAALFLLSWGTIVYLLVRSLPKVQEEEAGPKQRFIDRLAKSEIPEKVDMAVNAFLSKSLRRTKVALLKVDNFLTQRIKKLTVENGRADSAKDYKSIFSEKAAESAGKKDVKEV
ncbi:MAG: hypothetical protein HY435_00795 [Candidatus Liptonbacteria bacterium]|nr:hypothetical protein [Candidatus Liptonbacteria bacterium]